MFIFFSKLDASIRLFAISCSKSFRKYEKNKSEYDYLKNIIL